MTDIARPALAEGLTALTGKPPLLVVLGRACDVVAEASRVGYRPQSDIAATHGSAPTLWHRWTHASTAEAVEALATAWLWPWEPGDDPTRWWCDACRGSGLGDADDEQGLWYPCSDCTDGHAADPPSHTALVAVASLGRPRLLRYIYLADEIAHSAGCPDARVVWRVMTREAIVEHHRRASEDAERWDTERWDLPSIFSREERLRDIGNVSWPIAFVYEIYNAAIERRLTAAWSAMRSLAVGDEANLRPTGVHLVALDAARIVLAVEAIGGDR